MTAGQAPFRSIWKTPRGFTVQVVGTERGRIMLERLDNGHRVSVSPEQVLLPEKQVATTETGLEW